jgi:hypothetical protein
MCKKIIPKITFIPSSKASLNIPRFLIVDLNY